MTMQNISSSTPHVLIFPLPLQGAVNSMLKLAELFSVSDMNVTFLVTDHIYKRLISHSNVVSRFNKYSGFVLDSISDGLPEEHSRSGAKYIEMFDSMKVNTKPLLKEYLVHSKVDHGAPITCIIADGLMSFVCDVANDVGIPIFSTRTLSACSLSIFFALPQLIEAGELPFTGDDMDTPIKSVPGMEDFLRRRDLPHFCRTKALSDPSIKLFKNEGQENARAQGLILNTFEDLEGLALANIRALCPNTYTIGPLHALLKDKLAGKCGYTMTSSNSLRQEDRSCMTWLNTQPDKSVIYVSFGSIATLTKAQLMEFWYGLVNSGCKFLWVIRPDSVAGDGEIPAEVLEGTKERGFIVGWAPQEEVLAHKSVGGFLTHSGWNSTLESVIEGKPMLCWPYFMDQQVNSRFVSQVWRNGLDMKDSCDRVLVEKMVRDLMVERKDEFLKSAHQMAVMARKSLSEGGASSCNLNRLIQDIKSLAVDQMVQK